MQPRPLQKGGLHSKLPFRCAGDLVYPSCSNSLQGGQPCWKFTWKFIVPQCKAPSKRAAFIRNSLSYLINDLLFVTIRCGLYSLQGGHHFELQRARFGQVLAYHYRAGSCCHSRQKFPQARPADTSAGLPAPLRTQSLRHTLFTTAKTWHDSRLTFTAASATPMTPLSPPQSSTQLAFSHHPSREPPIEEPC